MPLGGLAGHKGYALALAVDVLGGALSKAGCSSKKKKNQHGNAVTFIAIKIQPFTSIKAFKNNLNDLYKHVKSSRLQKVKKIMVPGEFERESRKIFIKKGILLDKNYY